VGRAGACGDRGRPDRITPNEAYRLFLGMLDSVGLTVEHSGRFERIVETAKVKTMRGIPVYDETDVPNSVARESYVTVLVHLKDLSPEAGAAPPAAQGRDL